jgi:beta-lactamase regulating signal transducer with metallopeptidase domain
MLELPKSLSLFLHKTSLLLWEHARGMTFQFALLVVVLILLDLVFRKRVRATLRYGVWMLVIVKLVLPPTLHIPTSAFYWLEPQVMTSRSQLSYVDEFEYDAYYAEESTSQGDRPQKVESAKQLPSMPAITWPVLMLYLWGMGIAVLLTLVIQRTLFVRSLLGQTQPAPDSMDALLKEGCSKLDLKGPVQIRLSHAIASPAVCGLIRPMILLPTHLLDKLSHEAIYKVIMHELVHIRRKDLWVNWLQTLLNAIYFYNPLVWWVNSHIRMIREQAVDEVVLATLNTQAESYSKTLVDVAALSAHRESLGLRLVGIAECKRLLKGRILHMLNLKLTPKTRIGLSGMVTILLTGMILLPMAQANPSAKVTFPNTLNKAKWPILNGPTSSTASNWTKQNLPFSGMKPKQNWKLCGSKF